MILRIILEHSGQLFFKRMYLHDDHKMSEKIWVKLISTKLFKFYPYTGCLYKPVRISTFYLLVAIGQTTERTRVKLCGPLATMDAASGPPWMGTTHCGRRRWTVQGARARGRWNLSYVRSFFFGISAPNSVYWRLWRALSRKTWHGLHVACARARERNLQIF